MVQPVVAAGQRGESPQFAAILDGIDADRHRDRIVEAAAQLLTEGGPDAVSTRAVSAVQPPTIYLANPARVARIGGALAAVRQAPELPASEGELQDPR